MTTPKFQMIKYHDKEYPPSIPLRFQEIAAHFDIYKLKINRNISYSLHTEYSYGTRKFSNSFVRNFNEICNAHKNGVPQLWISKKWAEEFAEFIIKLTSDFPAPCIIEIHPPFSDYTLNLKKFADRYKVFEDIISYKYPHTKILIENRCGSIYQGGKFILSESKSIMELSNLIDSYNLKLKFALDIPQLYTAHRCSNKNSKKYLELLKEMDNIRHNIAGVHLWGKNISAQGRKVAHSGDLKSYFENDTLLLDSFLKGFVNLFGDDVIRKMVLEVNSSNEDLLSITKDLIYAGVQFV